MRSAASRMSGHKLGVMLCTFQVLVRTSYMAWKVTGQFVGRLDTRCRLGYHARRRIYLRPPTSTLRAISICTRGPLARGLFGDGSVLVPARHEPIQRPGLRLTEHSRRAACMRSTSTSFTATSRVHSIRRLLIILHG
ncbi:hypothetical protein PENSPDRAFT_449216 [Peniophora sp. CONT]|nr:hypothetical protein PENSPDRAFT_449216 [Peniophora sp. CONT]